MGILIPEDLEAWDAETLRAEVRDLYAFLETNFPSALLREPQLAACTKNVIEELVRVGENAIDQAQGRAPTGKLVARLRR